MVSCSKAIGRIIVVFKEINVKILNKALVQASRWLLQYALFISYHWSFKTAEVKKTRNCGSQPAGYIYMYLPKSLLRRICCYVYRDIWRVHHSPGRFSGERAGPGISILFVLIILFIYLNVPSVHVQYLAWLFFSNSSRFVASKHRN